MADNAGARRTPISIPFQFLVVSSNLVAAKLNEAFCTLKHYLSYIIRPHFNNTTSFYKCTALIIPTLATLLQLKSNSPFGTHERTVLLAASSSVAFYLSYIVLLRSTRRPSIVAAHVCVVCSGYASVASLLSLLFPDPSSPYVYYIFFFISAAELLYFYIRVEEEEEEDEEGVARITRFLNNICRIAANTLGRGPRVLPI